MTRRKKITIGILVFAVLWIIDGIFFSPDSKKKDNEKVTYISKPVESESLYWDGSDMEFSGGLKWYHSFAIHHGGYARFELDDEYEFINFVVGNYQYTGFPGEDAVVTVWADNKKIYDGVVRYDDVPEEVTANISGAKELTFKIAQGIGPVGFGDVTLWKKGEKPRLTQNQITGKPQTLELVKDLRPYYTYRIDEIGTGKHKSFKINGVKYDYGLVANMEMALIGDNPTKAHFYLRKQFSKLSFIVGMVDNKSHGSGWFSVKADGKIIYECELQHNATAKKVTLDIEGCDQLTFATKHATGDGVWGGIAEIMVYPEGEGKGLETGYEGDAPADANLKNLPDVTKLMSNVKPFSIGSDVDKQLYTGDSEHITFSMGGTRFSEGFILYEMANFMDDNITSYVVFDLGNEFDYVRFTAGYVGKSWTMYNDVLRVWADDEMILETPLIATSPNREFVLPIKKCRRLRFENKGQGTIDIAAYGIADLVVYRGRDTSENPFVHPHPDCPSEIDLIDLGKPYIHYVTQVGKEDILRDGSTMSQYFDLGGEKIYKGFVLKTSSHFSFDFGPLAGSDNAAAGVAGAIAAGVSFVPIGAAVGGAIVGSTLIGAAALLALAAGGTAVENSCAAFNTYGEYNSLTFTVGCLKPAYGELYTGYPESLLIGVDGEVAHEIALYDNMTPQTVTIPIEGCEQLMFWLANTNANSGQFLFYDLKLSKKRLPLSIPSELGGAKPLITSPEWDAPYDNYDNKVGRVAVSGSRAVDEYIKYAGDLFNDMIYVLKDAWVDYKVTTTFLKNRSGRTFKSVRLVGHKHGERFRFFDAPLTLDEGVYKEAIESLNAIEELYNDFNEVKSRKEDANSAYGSFTGSDAEKYKEYMDKSNSLMAQCDTLLPLMITQKKAEISYLRKIMDSRVSDIDGKPSTEYTNYCMVWDSDDVPPKSQIMSIDDYRPKE